MITQENEEVLYNEFYEKTKDCGRTQFVKLLMKQEEEKKKLKNQISDLECLVESIKLGVTLNKKQEKLLDKILFRSEK